MLSVTNGIPALILAPMEGVTDAPMRQLLTERGGFTFCVSEFFRISQDVPSARAIAGHVPELRNGGRTASGTPVQVQFLGGDPAKLALSAQRAVEAGARGIDLNFGCPAPTVNRHDGGATLLKHPERIRTIVSEVRRAVPLDIPVSAKLRLGWDAMDAVHVNADMAAEGGASWITIHGRTKMQGYTPPAYWDPIGEVRKRLPIPVVANGEIWTIDDLRRCRDVTGCQHFMIGRSALADPSLPHAIARELGVAQDPPLDPDWAQLFRRFAELGLSYSDRHGYVLCRVKQWLAFRNLKLKDPAIDRLRRAQDLETIIEACTIGACASI